MKTKITAYCFALALLVSSCAKETFTFSNTGTTYGSKKQQKEAVTANKEVVATTNTTAEVNAPAAENLTASTTKTIAIAKTDFTKAKPLFPNQAIAKKQSISTVAQVKTAIKLNKEVKALVKKAEKQNPPAAAAEGKSQIIAAVLAFVVGVLGVHRFYLGYTGIGIAQLLTLGGCGIWSLIDLIRIIIGDLKPREGDYTTKF